MASNDFENLCRLYLRLNGFFHIANFTLHFVDKQAEEVDFVGVRLPNSKEIPMNSSGAFRQRETFRDDSNLISEDITSRLILLMGEASATFSKAEIQKKVNKLSNDIRRDYVMKRFGAIQQWNPHLLKVLFLTSNKLVPEDNDQIKFITLKQMSDFINSRAEHALKASAVHLLPPRLQEAVILVKTLALEEPEKDRKRQTSVSVEDSQSSSTINSLQSP